MFKCTSFFGLLLVVPAVFGSYEYVRVGYESDQALPSRYERTSKDHPYYGGNARYNSGYSRYDGARRSYIPPQKRTLDPPKRSKSTAPKKISMLQPVATLARNILEVFSRASKRYDIGRKTRSNRHKPKPDAGIDQGGRVPAKLISEFLFSLAEAYDRAFNTVVQRTNNAMERLQRNRPDSYGERPSAAPALQTSQASSSVYVDPTSGQQMMNIGNAEQFAHQLKSCAARIREKTAQYFTDYDLVDAILHRLGIHEFEEQNIRSILQSAASIMVQYEVEASEERIEAIKKKAKRRNVISMNMVPRVVPVQERLRDFARSARTISTSEAVLEAFFRIILEEYENVMEIVKIANTSVSLAIDGVTSLVRKRAPSGQLGQKVEALFAAPELRVSFHIHFIIKAVTDIMRQGGELDAGTANAIYDALSEFQAQHAAFKTGIMYRDSPYGTTSSEVDTTVAYAVVPISIEDLRDASLRKKYMAETLDTCFARIPFDNVYVDAANRVLNETIAGRAVYDSIITLLMDPETGDRVMQIINIFLIRMPNNESLRPDYIQATLTALSVLRHSMDKQMKESSSNSSSKKSSLNVPNLLESAENELSRVWAFFSDSKHANGVQRAIIYLLDALYEVWPNLPGEPSKRRLEAFIRRLRSNYADYNLWGRVRDFLRKDVDQRKYGQFADIVRKGMPQEEHEFVFTPEQVDYLASAIFEAIQDEESPALVKAAQKIRDRFAPLVRAHSSADLGQMMRALAEEPVPVLIQLSFIERLPGVLDYIVDVLLPDESTDRHPLPRK